MNKYAEIMWKMSQEVTARAKHPFWHYRPHEKQAEFHRSAAKCRFVFGGNRTGKSECGAVETIWRATGMHPYAAKRHPARTKPHPARICRAPAHGNTARAASARALPLEVLHGTPKARPSGSREQGAVVNTAKHVRTGISYDAPSALFPLLSSAPSLSPADGVSCWVVSLTRQVQRDVAQEKILKYLPKQWIVQIVMAEGGSSAPEYGVIDFIIVKNKFGGVSKIGFRNCEQGRERFAGVGLDFIWFDEEPPEDIYDECLLRLLDRGGVHFATMTPLKGRSWVFDRIYLAADANPEVDLFSMSWADNPYLNRAEIETMEKNLPPGVLESRKFGRFADSSGLVFGEFTDENITDPFPVSEMRDKYISIDTGWTDPTAILWVCRDIMSNLYVVADYEVRRTTVEMHSSEIMRRTAELGWELSEVKILMDSAANQHTAGSPVSVAEQYRRNGIAADTNVNKNIFEGVMAVKAAFCSANGRERKLFVFKNCVNLLRELRGCFWGDNDRPRGGDDHTLDALRYLIMHVKGQDAAHSRSCGILGEAKRKIMKRVRSNYG